MTMPARPISLCRLIGSAFVLLGLLLVSSPRDLQAQECDFDELDELYRYQENPPDDGFYYGLGEATSLNRPFARRMAMSVATGQLVLAAVSDWTGDLTQDVLAENPGQVSEVFLEEWNASSEQRASARVTNVQTERSYFCAPGDNRWTFVLIVSVDQVNLTASVAGDVREEMESRVESGDVEYSQREIDIFFGEVDNMLDERRQQRVRQG